MAAYHDLVRHSRLLYGRMALPSTPLWIRQTLPRQLHALATKPALWLGLFAVLSLTALVPLFIVKRPPSHDLAQHLAAVHMLRVYPEQGLGAEIELQLGQTQYIGFYALALLLSYPFGVLLGTKLLIAAVALAVPWGVWVLLKALEREPRHAFFALPLTLSAPLLFGLYNYMAGIALMLFAFAAAVRLSEAYSHRRFVALTLVLSLMVLTHFVPVVFALLGCVLLLWESNYRKALRNLLSLAPLLLLNVIWMLTAKAAGPATELPNIAAARPLAKVLGELPAWLTCVLTNQVDDWLWLAWLTLALTQLVLAVRVSPWPHERKNLLAQRLAWLAPLAWLCYFLLPHKHQWVYPVAPRFAVLAALLSVLLLPRISQLKTSVISLVLACVVLLQTASLGTAFRAVQKEEGDIEQAIAIIPEGRRVSALIFSQSSKHVTLQTFRHYSSLYQAKKGGVVSRSFVGLPTSPFSYKHGLPTQPVWSVKSNAIDPAQDLPSFEYVLVRGGPGKIASDRRFSALYKGKKWQVYRRTDISSRR